eukprot:682050-Amphidinium_carterae.3
MVGGGGGGGGGPCLSVKKTFRCHPEDGILTTILLSPKYQLHMKQHGGWFCGTSSHMSPLRMQAPEHNLLEHDMWSSLHHSIRI